MKLETQVCEQLWQRGKVFKVFWYCIINAVIYMYTFTPTAATLTLLLTVVVIPLSFSFLSSFVYEVDQ
jgi:hypothetical protein